MSSMPTLLKKLQKANEDEFLKISDILAKRLEDEMATATRPKPGLLAVISTNDEQQQGPIVSILKLDATKEAARFRELAKGAIRLQLLRELLPAPEELQKGLSWPDPRDNSDAIILDRNLEAAKYFLNAYELDVSARSVDTEKAILKTIAASLPDNKVRAAYKLVADRSGSAPDIVAELKTEFPELDDSSPVLRAAAPVPGMVRPNMIRAQKMVVRADGFEIRVPAVYSDRIQWDRDGDGWVITIRTDSKPRWDV